MIADNFELASIFRRGADLEELDPDEITRIEALMEVYFTNLGNVDHQYKSDLYFDEDDDEDLVWFVAPAYRDLLTCIYGSNWWDGAGAPTLRIH
jgi:hypothetical protein